RARCAQALAGKNQRHHRHLAAHLLAPGDAAAVVGAGRGGDPQRGRRGAESAARDDGRAAGGARRPPYWRFNRRWRQLYLSAYHVSDTSAPGYAEAIRRYGSRWITGYGSAIAALAESAMGGGVAPVALCAAIVSGDTLLPGMRADIEKFFSCKCFDSYGQAEGVCMAMECARGKMHVIPEAGLWEILRDDGAPCAPGEVGEIVAT